MSEYLEFASVGRLEILGQDRIVFLDVPRRKIDSMGRHLLNDGVLGILMTG